MPEADKMDVTQYLLSVCLIKCTQSLSGFFSELKMLSTTVHTIYNFQIAEVLSNNFLNRNVMALLHISLKMSIWNSYKVEVSVQPHCKGKYSPSPTDFWKHVVTNTLLARMKTVTVLVTVTSSLLIGPCEILPHLLRTSYLHFLRITPATGGCNTGSMTNHCSRRIELLSFCLWHKSGFGFPLPKWMDRMKWVGPVACTITWSQTCLLLCGPRALQGTVYSKKSQRAG
jgi:hypothetical protein